MPRHREEADLFFCSVTPLQNVRNENLEASEVICAGVKAAISSWSRIFCSDDQIAAVAQSAYPDILLLKCQSPDAQLDAQQMSSVMTCTVECTSRFVIGILWERRKGSQDGATDGASMQRLDNGESKVCFLGEFVAGSLVLSHTALDTDINYLFNSSLNVSRIA